MAEADVRGVAQLKIAVVSVDRSPRWTVDRLVQDIEALLNDGGVRAETEILGVESVPGWP